MTFWQLETAEAPRHPWDPTWGLCKLHAPSQKGPPLCVNTDGVVESDISHDLISFMSTAQMVQV